MRDNSMNEEVIRLRSWVAALEQLLEAHEQAVLEQSERLERSLEALTRRAAELETVAEVSIAAATILSPEELLQTVVDLTKERFGLYHAHIYRLIEAEGTLVLAAGAGDVGRQMVAQGWRIPLGQERSLVARAARSRAGVIVSDVRVEPDFLPNPLLPETRAEMAVPMIVKGKVLGVLDVQSDEVDRFSEEDVRIQTTLAAQVTVVLQNAAQYEQIQQVLTERERLLAEVQRLAAIVEHHPDFIGVGALEGQVLYVNPAGLKMMGLPPDHNVTTMNVNDFYPAAEADMLIKHGLPAALREGAWSSEANLLKVDGTTVPVDETVSINYDADGNPNSISITMRDITGRKQAEAERERLLTEVEAAYRQYVQREWREFLGQRQSDSWHIEYQQAGLPVEVDSQGLRVFQAEVTREGKSKAISGAGDNGHETEPAIVTPIVLRGEVIGTLSLQDIDSERAWTADEIALVETVSEQLALTLENLRLFDETRKRAGREQLTRQITDKMRASPDVEMIIQTGLAELAKGLGASRTYVKLTPRLEQDDE